MRYTLRLLTLQQFQRATALVCTCEMIRHMAGTRALGSVPFQAGAVGRRQGDAQLPGSRPRSLRQPLAGRHAGRERRHAHQLTSCPWCGREIRAHHIKVYEAPGDVGRCVTYCGDPMGTCDFSEATKAAKRDCR